MNTLTASKKMTSLRIDKGLFTYIEEKAKEANRSVNNYIETVLWSSTGYKDPLSLTDEDLTAFAKSDEDIKAGRIKTAEEIQQKARELCMK